MIELNIWKPVDASKPIPRPTNERQVLCIYRPDHDKAENRAHARGPYSKGPSQHGITCDPKVDHDKYLYWDHGWLRDERDGKGPLVYDTNYMKDLQYCIIEFPVPNR